ncbi:hypothetical protein [uncultured Campylobacter sp.]|uniref:hypothetical protein n=1 Tax=uncultured Campylobacter sp. TaxID=218934 RepID=UPI002619BD82|nr:hypothetical protein [uncultured Campylobacter sp.]
MIERKPSATTLARAVNLSPINPSNEKAKFATDLDGKFDGEPFRAAKGVKFKRETTTKTPALPQIKFDPNVGSKREHFWLSNLTYQAVRTANQTLANSTRSGASKQTSNLASNLTKRH